MKRLQISTPKLIASGIVLFLLLVYAGSYFLIVESPSGWSLPSWATLPSRTIRMKFVEVNGDWEVFPNNHGLPDALFAPMHQLDRDYLRPGKWRGKSSKNADLDFGWLVNSFNEKAPR